MVSSHHSNVIRMAYGLGFAGVLPFFVGAGLSSVDFTYSGISAEFLLTSYGALILSFLGGLHWGRVASADKLSARDAYWLVHSIWPSLVGWGALALPSSNGNLVLAAGFIICAYIDIKLIKAGLFAAWMYRLRLTLSFGAVVSLMFPVLFR